MKPWLWLPPQLAHDLSPYGLKVLSPFFKISDPKWCSFHWKTPFNQNLEFRNPLGIAGGVDKNAVSVVDWQNLGCGFLEIGTVTPQTQKANPGKIMDRDLSTKSLWNKMGFPSEGAEKVENHLLQLRKNQKINIPIFLNLGKNRETPNEKAHQDYIQLMNRFQNVADAFVINISSPNTKGLRDLAQAHVFAPFIESLVKCREALSLPLPLLIKLSPDLDPTAFFEILNICLNYSVDGFILTNTTLSRTDTPFYPVEGGVSGNPLKSLSTRYLAETAELCAKQKTKKIIISTGGVMTVDDVFERIEKGADLVQVYSALVFEGPLFFRKVAELAKEPTSKFAKQYSK